MELDHVENEEELERLRQELGQARQDIENLRTDAAVSIAISNVTAEDGSKSIAQQVVEQVDAIRLDLDRRHAERVQQAEDQYQQRTDKMRTQLSKRLTERKDLIKQEVEQEHRSEIDRLSAEHDEEIRSLNARHQEELSQLRQEAESRFEQEKERRAAEHSSAPATQEPNAHVQDLDVPVGDWQLSEGHLRELARINPIMQGILRSNISTQVKKVREEQERACDTRVGEATAKADKEKEQAVAMEAQRQKVKLSMAEGKVRTMTAKVDVVQQAASETPERPVAEVWETARVAKPAPVTATAAAGQVAGAKPAVPIPSQVDSAGPTQGTTQQASQPPPSPFASLNAQQAQQAQPSPTTALAPPTLQTAIPSAPQAHQNPFAGSGIPQLLQGPLSGLQSIPRQPSFTPGVLINPFAQNVQAGPQLGQQQGAQSLPPRPGQGQPGASFGTGPDGPRSMIGQGQSMLPRLPGIPGRGGFGVANPIPHMALPSPTTDQDPGQQQQQQQRYPQQQQPQQHKQGGGRARGRGRSGSQRKDGSDSDSFQSFGQSHPPNQGLQGGDNPKGNLNASARQFIPASGAAGVPDVPVGGDGGDGGGGAGGSGAGVGGVGVGGFGFGGAGGAGFGGVGLVGAGNKRQREEGPGDDGTGGGSGGGSGDGSGGGGSGGGGGGGGGGRGGKRARGGR